MNNAKLVAYLTKRMREENLRKTDLAPLFGSRSRVSEFFSGKRGLSLLVAKRLYRWGVPADVIFGSVTPSARAKDE